MSDNDLIRRSDALKLLADGCYDPGIVKSIAALPAVMDTAAWNTAIQAAADGMLPTVIGFRGSLYEPALNAAMGRTLALLKP